MNKLTNFKLKTKDEISKIFTVPIDTLKDGNNWTIDNLPFRGILYLVLLFFIVFFIL